MKSIIFTALILGGLGAKPNILGRTHAMLTFESANGKKVEMRAFQESEITEEIPGEDEVRNIWRPSVDQESLARVIRDLRKPEPEEPLPLYLN
jgi:hypothetical protein